MKKCNGHSHECKELLIKTTLNNRTCSKAALSKTALFLVNCYQIYLSPIFGGQCRFYPSCSEYAREAFIALPAHRAFWLSMKRLFKCHPFGPSGFDPVPRYFGGESKL